MNVFLTFFVIVTDFCSGEKLILVILQNTVWGTAGGARGPRERCEELVRVRQRLRAVRVRVRHDVRREGVVRHRGADAPQHLLEGWRLTPEEQSGT